MHLRVCAILYYIVTIYYKSVPCLHKTTTTDDIENCLEKVCCIVAADTNGAIKNKPNKRELLSRVNNYYILL